MDKYFALLRFLYFVQHARKYCKYTRYELLYTFEYVLHSSIFYIPIFGARNVIFMQFVKLRERWIFNEYTCAWGCYVFCGFNAKISVHLYYAQPHGLVVVLYTLISYIQEALNLRSRNSIQLYSGLYVERFVSLATEA